jgi:hypothetical protein
VYFVFNSLNLWNSIRFKLQHTVSATELFVSHKIVLFVDIKRTPDFVLSKRYKIINIRCDKHPDYNRVWLGTFSCSDQQQSSIKGYNSEFRIVLSVTICNVQINYRKLILFPYPCKKNKQTKESCMPLKLY